MDSNQLWVTVSFVCKQDISAWGIQCNQWEEAGGAGCKGRCMHFPTKEIQSHATNHWVIGKTAPSEKRNVCLPSGTEEANDVFLAPT